MSACCFSDARTRLTRRPQHAHTQAKHAPRRAVAACTARDDIAETTYKQRASVSAVALFSAALIASADLAAPPPSLALSARMEGTEVAELLAAQEAAGKKPAAKPAPAKPAPAKPKPVPKPAPARAAPAPKPVAGKDAPVDLPQVKYAVPEPVKRAAPAPAQPAPKPVVKAPPKPAPKSFVKAPSKPAPKPVVKAPSKPAAKAPPVPKAPVAKANPSAPKPLPGKLQKANLAELKEPAPEPVKGGKGMQLKSEAPKSRLAALTAGGAGLGAGLFGLGKSAAAGNAAKGAAAKSAAAATSADAAEAVSVIVAGAVAGQMGTSVVNRTARVRVIRRTPEGELPLPLQAAFALSVPASFAVALLQFLLSV